MEELIKYIENQHLGSFKKNVSFKDLTTYKSGGEAALVCYPDNVDKLVKLLKHLKEKQIAYKIWGYGSNILASDDFYDGVIIKLAQLKEINLNEDILSVEAGHNLITLSYNISKAGYTGLEFASGIPATVGGAVAMNAGAYKKSISDILISVDVLDENFEYKTLSLDELNCGYRKTVFKDKPYICIRAHFKINKGSPEEILNDIENKRLKRIKSQPLEYPCAGSVFRNPEGDFAGRLIEECNLKGKLYKGAQISSKHANFIINKNNATSESIKYLIDLAHNEVLKKYNINLINEQELFNFK